MYKNSKTVFDQKSGSLIKQKQEEEKIKKKNNLKIKREREVELEQKPRLSTKPYCLLRQTLLVI